MKKTQQKTWCSAVAAFLVVGMSAAHASAGDAALAEQLFREGRERLEAGDYAAACPKLEESYAQDPATGTLLALAVCQESTGKTASAWANYGEVAARSKREGRADREQAATEHQTALEQKLSYLTINVDARSRDLPGLVVTRDGVSVGKAAWGSAFPTDPGVHQFKATAPGKQGWEGSITIAAQADRQVVTIPALSDATPVPAAVVAPPPPQTGEAPPAPTTTSSSSTLRWVGAAVGGAGVVALGVGTYFGIHATSLDASSKEDGHCNANNQCDSVGGARRNDAIAAGNVSTAMFITGGVLAAAGVTLFVVGAPSGGKKDAARLQPKVALGPTAARISLSF
jgi:hypothetical protein